MLIPLAGSGGGIGFDIALSLSSAKAIVVFSGTGSIFFIIIRGIVIGSAWDGLIRLLRFTG